MLHQNEGFLKLKNVAQEIKLLIKFTLPNCSTIFMDFYFSDQFFYQVEEYLRRTVLHRDFDFGRRYLNN